MGQGWLLAVLVAGVIVLTPLAERIKVPQPVLLTVYGVVLWFLPLTGPLDLEPELILPVVLPPLLFAATQRTTSTEFREHARAVLALAVGLTLSTTVAVALAAHLAGLSWATAFVLGAIVSPPDPVAATAVARRLRLPQRLVTILEGEGMFNDATALVAYKIALAVVVTGEFSYGGTLLQLALTVVLGVVVGLLLGVVARFLLGRIHEGYAETTITVLVPFLSYVVAEEVGGSGVLAVLVLGLYLRNVAHPATTSQGWLLGRSVWAYADFLITALVFAVLGYELAEVLDQATLSSDVVVLSVVVVVTVVLFRGLWIFAVTGLLRARARRRDVPLPIGWQETTVVSWSGMRGVVTVATALALPMTVDAGGPLPERNTLVVAAFGCVVVTLLVQGLTLAPLTGWLGVGGEGSGEEEVVRLRQRAAREALDFVRGDGSEGVAEEVRHAAELQYDGFLSAQDALERARRLEPGEDHDPADELATLLRRATGVERDLVLRARRTGEVSAGAADDVLREIEGRAMRDLG